MLTIQEYITNRFASEPYLTNVELGKELGISKSMISHYKQGYFPSLDVAKLVYSRDGVVLHPYAKESLEKELSDV